MRYRVYLNGRRTCYTGAGVSQASRIASELLCGCRECPLSGRHVLSTSRSGLPLFVCIGLCACSATLRREARHA